MHLCQYWRCKKERKKKKIGDVVRKLKSGLNMLSDSTIEFKLLDFENVYLLNIEDKCLFFSLVLFR